MIRATFGGALAVAGMIVLATAGCAANSESTTLDADTTAYLEENAASLATQLGIENPPAVELVRIISLSEWAPTQIACLREAGYDVTETSDGEGVKYPSIEDPALVESLNLAVYECEVKYPVDRKYMMGLSPEQLEALYTYRSTELVDCLERLGYEVDAAPPSRAVFIEQDGKWSPYEGLLIKDEDLKTAYATCPQTPESIYSG